MEDVGFCHCTATLYSGFNILSYQLEMFHLLYTDIAFFFVLDDLLDESMHNSILYIAVSLGFISRY